MNEQLTCACYCRPLPDNSGGNHPYQKSHLGRGQLHTYSPAGHILKRCIYLKRCISHGPRGQAAPRTYCPILEKGGTYSAPHRPPCHPVPTPPPTSPCHGLHAYPKEGMCIIPLGWPTPTKPGWHAASNTSPSSHSSLACCQHRQADTAGDRQSPLPAHNNCPAPPASMTDTMVALLPTTVHCQ